MPKRITVPTELANRALAGNAEAQFELADLYMQSEHDDDITLAEEWALKAAENGQIEAMYWLGEGYTVYAKELREEDPEESKANIEKHPAATLELAGYYRRGDVVEKDEVKSVALVKQAAEWGEAQAMRDLACIYEHGIGVDANEEQADYWTKKAESLEEK